MIHKFEAVRKDSCLRDNVYVFIDEAHRSVAKDLGIYLMAAVPKATIIGFTGTPIAHTSQGKAYSRSSARRMRWVTWTSTPLLRASPTRPRYRSNT